MGAVERAVWFIEHRFSAEVTLDAIAEAAGVSRFHLCRLFGVATGRSVMRYVRGRRLTEAARALAGGAADILAVALDAGYGSHEAFTRAFPRAYGVAPAAWRRSPGRIRIPAPSDVHFHPPGSLRLPARDKVTAMDLMTRMVEHHVWLTGEMVRLAGRLTDGQLDQPIELDVDDDRQTIRSLLSRLIGQMGMWNAAVAMRDYDWSVEEHESLISMRRRLAEEGPTYLTHVHDVVAQGRLDDTFVDALCEPPESFTYGGVLSHVLTYGAIRREALASVLRELGAEVSIGDPILWEDAQSGRTRIARNATTS